MKIEYKGIMENVVTFLKSDAMSVGDLVKVISDDSVTRCTGADTFDGVVVNVNDSTVAVQLCGFATVPVASTVTVGRKKLAVDSSGNLEESDSGRECVVVNCDAFSATATVYFS